MRFAVHGSGGTRGLQIDWDEPVEIDAEIRAAMASYEDDVDAMQSGRLRRGYMCDGVLLPRGSVALRLAEGHEIYLQLPTNTAPAALAPTPKAPTTASTHVDGVFDRHRVVVGGAHDGERIDVILVAAVPELSRAVVQRLIDGGHATVGGAACPKSNRRLRRGDVVELVVARVEGD